VWAGPPAVFPFFPVGFLSLLPDLLQSLLQELTLVFYTLASPFFSWQVSERMSPAASSPFLLSLMNQSQMIKTRVR